MNGYKDELFTFTAQPAKSVSWNFNYYVGQDHPDVMPATNCTAPVQPGLCLAAIIPAPNGKAHIFDSRHATLEYDPGSLRWRSRVIMSFNACGRMLGRASRPHPSRSTAVRDTPAISSTRRGMALAGRGEHILSDKGGLYTGTSQVLNELTGTYEYKSRRWISGARGAPARPQRCAVLLDE